MKSPFPGMDPYLKKSWRDVHSRLVIYASDQLNRRLPDDLRCRVEERVVVEPDEGDRRSIYPDVRVVERPGRVGGTAILDQVEVGEPLVFKVRREIATETFIEIIDVASGHRVVTVIEFLSPTNKFPGSVKAST